jgi:hypothetical protein
MPEVRQEEGGSDEANSGTHKAGADHGIRLPE